MKILINLRIPVILALLIFATGTSGTAQIINPKKEAGNQAEQRANQKIGQGIDKGLNKLEEGLGGMLKKKKKNEQTAEEEPEPTVAPETDEPVESTAGTPARPKLESVSKYDFVPGDQILYFEDFSQDAIGDFPALWTTTGSGEVKTVNIAPGNWFHLNGEDASYCYSKDIPFPSNFIMEFDIIPMADFNGLQVTFYQDPENKEVNDGLYPGNEGLHIEVGDEGWNSKGYTYKTEADDLNGQSRTNPVVAEEVNHVIFWIQNRRLRIYHKGAKALDMPTNIYANAQFHRFRFSNWNRTGLPFISNIKITTASPDTRSKLITEGKIVSYGIYFDVNSDVVKPESAGALNEIAKVLKENPGVRVKIVGHTDSDGDDTKNLDLSQRRAASVKNALASEYGITASQLETDGKGESEPIETNTSTEGKAKNRRVEFIKIG